MNLYTTQDINRIIAYNIRFNGIDMDDLLDRAGKAIVREIERRWPQDTPVYIFAGPYENGAYAMATARHFFIKGRSVKVILFNIQRDPAQELCKRERERLKSVSFPNNDFTEIVTGYKPISFEQGAIVVDGIFGSELNRNLEGGYTNIIKRLNSEKINIVSIDVPSGMSGDWNTHAVPNNIIKARLTIALQFPHLAFFLPTMAGNIGEWVTVDIGIREGAFTGTQQKYVLFGKNEAAYQLGRRNPFSSKHDYGNGIIFAGSFGMLGAAVMAARGALRSGIGKLTVSTPLCGFPVIQSTVPEALYQYAESNEHFTRIATARRQKYDAVAIGPGIGTHEDTISALDNYLSTMPSPVILDADALNCIAMRPTLLHKIPNMSVITPHEKEFDRLFGEQPNADARLLKAIEVAKTYNLVIVLKGHYTAVVLYDGRISFNSSGTPALATPGSGDVLTGIITSFMAQLKNPILAAMLGVYIHGVAGKIAGSTHGNYGVIASDIAEATGKAIQETLTQ